MHPHSSSTRSSKLSNLLSHKVFLRTLQTGAWTALCLLAFDLAANLLFPYPSDPRATPKQMNQYFNYGRSIEGKLTQMVRPTDQESHALVSVGWLDPASWKKLQAQPAQDENILVAFYGQSFAAHVADGLKKLDSRVGLRILAGPSAPPNFAYAAYNLDRRRHGAKVVVFTVLASSVKGLRAMNGMTWQFEGPAPYTYPRYSVKNGRLEEVMPSIQSEKQFRMALQNPQKWRNFTQQLEVNDQYYNPFLFQHNVLDNSAIVRLLRRAYAQHHQKQMEQLAYNANTGFNQEYEVPVLAAMVKEFASTAQQDGKLPIVLLVNDRNYSDALFKALQPTLEQQSIPYISTHSVAPASDLTNFISDGHFTDSANQKIATAMLELINQRLSRQPKASQ